MPFQAKKHLHPSPLILMVNGIRPSASSAQEVSDSDYVRYKVGEKSERIPEEEFRKLVVCFRALALVTTIFVALNVHSVDLWISTTYSSLLRCSFFHHYSFEPLWASTCFTVSIFFFWVIDKHVPILHRYRTQSSDSLLAWKDRVRDGLTNEVPWYLGFWIPFGGIMKARRIPVTSPTLKLVTYEVLMGLIIYDFLFFVGHNILHKSPILYSKIHSKHHKMSTVRAGDAVRHTFFDGMWDVICAVVALNLLQAHAFSRLTFNAVAIYLIVEAHSGMNFPWMLHNIVPFQIFAGRSSLFVPQSLSHSITLYLI